MVRCNSTLKQKCNVLEFNGKFLFINNFMFTFMFTGVTNRVTNVTMDGEMKR